MASEHLIRNLGPLSLVHRLILSITFHAFITVVGFCQKQSCCLTSNLIDGRSATQCYVTVRWRTSNGAMNKVLDVLLHWGLLYS